MHRLYPSSQIPAKCAVRCSIGSLAAPANECPRSVLEDPIFAKPTIPETESIRLIHEAIDRGITFMDNSWDYNQGQSEARMGKAHAEGGYRDKAFLMTKVDTSHKRFSYAPD